MSSPPSVSDAAHLPDPHHGDGGGTRFELAECGVSDLSALQRRSIEIMLLAVSDSLGPTFLTAYERGRNTQFVEMREKRVASASPLSPISKCNNDSYVLAHSML